MLEHYLLPPPYVQFERVPATQTITSQYLLKRGTLVALRPWPDASGIDVLEEASRIRHELPRATVILWLDQLDEQPKIELVAAAAKDGIRGFVTGATPHADVLRQELTDPTGLETDVIRYLSTRGYPLSRPVRDLVYAVFDHAAECRTLVELSRYVDTSRILAKEIKACGLGTPKPFFQVMRYIVIANEMQRDIATPVERIALRYRFNDASNCRHRMLEVLGQRPKGDIVKSCGLG